MLLCPHPPPSSFLSILMFVFFGLSLIKLSVQKKKKSLLSRGEVQSIVSGPGLPIYQIHKNPFCIKYVGKDLAGSLTRK